MNGTQDRLVEAMLSPCFYDHPVSNVTLIETHISLVFLAGDFAYKLKKPLNLGFLDFSSLEKRRHYCREELRLNRRFAPQLYVEVCTVGGPPDKPVLGGTPALDFLVKMRRFPCQNQLDRMLEDGRLDRSQLEAFAINIADHHRLAEVADRASAFGSAAAVTDPVLENFAQLGPILPDELSREQCRTLELWSRQACDRLRDFMRHRKQEGFIRECHGDIHLGNMVWWDGRPLLFDCIEFDENLRWIDLVNDIAFLVMDLDDRGESTLGWAFLNGYLQRTGDYQGVELLNFYKVYRAMVRAKVTCLRLGQPGLEEREKAVVKELVHSYLELAGRYTQPPSPQLIITHGLSGAGKTTFIHQLAPLCQAIRMHSDVERKRLAGLGEQAESHSPSDGGIYSAEATTATYTHLFRLAQNLLQAGITALVDATFLQRQQRLQMRQLAERLRVPFRILDFSLDEALLRQRVGQRSRETGRISEATVDVLDRQLRRQETLGTDETQFAICIQPDSAAAQVAERLRA